MSTRHIRKYLGGNVLPPPEEDSDYEPLYASSSTNTAQNKFTGLFKSDSESDAEQETIEKESEEEVEQVQKQKKKNKKKKSKKKALELDEIDRSLQEVNALLGAPPPAPVTEVAPESEVDKLFKIDGKHLNPATELRRLLGPDEDEIKKRRKRGGLYINRGLIIPTDDTFKKVGITMSMSPQKVDGQNLFLINHDQTYQKRHRQFTNLLILTKEDFPPLDLNYSLEYMHVEAILQITDLYFALEDYDRAKKLLEKVVSYLQFISHPLFRITDRCARLEYKVLENRLYHVAMLKYIYVMTNSACHRTGLEIAKVLLNLDPSDPLALIILVDMLALRAREHQWLIDTVDCWKIHRNANFMVNLLYSYALSHFHVIKKKKGDVSEADVHLQNAMRRFPMMVPELAKAINIKILQMNDCEIFKEKKETPRYVKELWQDLTKYYTMFTASKWREPEVCAWFTRNVVALVQQFDADEEVRNAVKLFATQREVMRCLPKEIVRHFQVIKHMNNFVFDEPNVFTPRTALVTYNPEPYPAQTLNRYGYAFTRPMVPEMTGSIVGGFIRSLGPEFNPRRGGANNELNEDGNLEPPGEPIRIDLFNGTQIYIGAFGDEYQFEEALSDTDEEILEFLLQDDSDSD